MGHDDNSNPPDADQPDKDVENAVGYGRPPKKNQFKPGQSGNPKGRPKGSKSLSATLNTLMHERVSVSENGRRRRMTKVEALMRRLLNKAMMGDYKSIQGLAVLDKILNDQASNSGPSAVRIADEAAILEGYKRRLTEELASIPGRSE